MKNFTFIDFYAGIGGFRVALENLGGECIAFSEIDKKAIDVYKQNFNTEDEIELGDITKVDEFPYADILVGGVPCQSWSIAGKNKGFEDPRGKLWEDTIRATKQIQPKAFIYENVKGLADPRNKANLSLILEELSSAGYKVEYKVLNAFDYGLPQSRERIFLVGIRSDLFTSKYEYPKRDSKFPLLQNILEGNLTKEHKRRDSRKKLNSFSLASKVNKGNFFIFSDVRNGDYTIHSWDLVETTDKEKEICIAILRNRRKSKFGKKDGNPMSFEDIGLIFNDVFRDLLKEDELETLVNKRILRKVDNKYEFSNSKISSGLNGIYRIFLPSSYVFSTLTKTGSRDFIATKEIPSNIHTKDKKNYFLEKIYNTGEFRKITVLEAIRLQGFPDSFIFNTKPTIAFGLLGNAVAVDIVEKVAANLLSKLNGKDNVK